MTRRSPARANRSTRQQPVDPTPEGIAAVQRQAPHWLILWSLYRRRYNAYAMFGDYPSIVENADPIALLGDCHQIERATALQKHPR